MHGDKRKNSCNQNRLENRGMLIYKMSTNILEQKNNDYVSELLDHIAYLKRLTINIGNKVCKQNRLLDSL